MILFVIKNELMEFGDCTAKIGIKKTNIQLRLNGGNMSSQVLQNTSLVVITLQKST